MCGFGGPGGMSAFRGPPLAGRPTAGSGSWRGSPLGGKRQLRRLVLPPGERAGRYRTPGPAGTSSGGFPGRTGDGPAQPVTTPAGSSHRTSRLLCALAALTHRARDSRAGTRAHAENPGCSLTPRSVGPGSAQLPGSQPSPTRHLGRCQGQTRRRVCLCAADSPRGVSGR